MPIIMNCNLGAPSRYKRIEGFLNTVLTKIFKLWLDQADTDFHMPQ